VVNDLNDIKIDNEFKDIVEVIKIKAKKCEDLCNNYGIISIEEEGVKERLISMKI
jgi:hypothetical protein